MHVKALVGNVLKAHGKKVLEFETGKINYTF